MKDIAPIALADWRREISDLYGKIRVEPDPKSAWDIWHTRRSQLFTRHPMSPLEADQRASFGSIPVFDYDPALRFAVRLKEINQPAFSVELGDDGQLQLEPLARTVGLADNLSSELTLYWIAGYGGGLFLPFADASSNKQTYGGGRYLLDTIKGADLGLSPDGELILDFNFSYNPSCAWNEGYICPLAPPQNRLGISIAAGEKRPFLPNNGPSE
jgi:uncharacterized protein